MKPKRIEDPELLATVRRLPCMACLSLKDHLTREEWDQLASITEDPDNAMDCSDPDHIATVGSGGDDVAVNLMPSCRSHHSERHQHGIAHMADKYSLVKIWLNLAGWVFDERQKKWKRLE